MNYQKLYRLQNLVFKEISGNYDAFYLTGGTALGRFFLNHRFSDDLDFFVNDKDDFILLVQHLKQRFDKSLSFSVSKLIQFDTFVRLWVSDNDTELKIEFVNDVPSRMGQTMLFENIPLDNPANILSNKLSAVVSRDEAKDVFDIVTLAEHYSFSWVKIFEYTIKKAIVADVDVAMRLSTFPVALLETVKWHAKPFEKEEFAKKLQVVANDFLLARDNSLGAGKVPISEAMPISY